jgi:hypothetical protein
LSFAPKSYFGPQQLGQYLLSKVKGATVREKLKALFRQGRRFELAQLLGENGISKDDLKRLESLHPAFMGGNYLPDVEPGEIGAGSFFSRRSLRTSRADGGGA